MTDLAWVDAKLLNGLLNDVGLDLPSSRQLGQGSHGDALGVNLKVSPQRRPRVAPAKAIGAQRIETTWHPARDHLRQ